MGRVSKPTQRSRSALPKRSPEVSSLIVDLLHEFHTIAADTGRALGATPQEQKRALELALKRTPRRRPSQVVLKNDVSLALMLDTWRKDATYRLPDGTPKVLPIRGRQSSLMRLAKQCRLKLPIDQVVQLLCAQSEVAKLKGGKVAIVGNPANIVEGTTATVLAWIITQLRHVAETNVFNSRLPIKKRGDTGRFERQVWGMLTGPEFRSWSRDARPFLQEAANRVENSLDSAGVHKKRGKKQVCGIGLYIFREDGNLG